MSQNSYALLVVSGKRPGKEFLLKNNQEMIAGRSNSADIVLPDEMVSRNHAKFLVQQNQIFLQDLHSANGIFVNGEKINTATVKPGDRIQIGTNILSIHVSHANGTVQNGNAVVSVSPKGASPVLPSKAASSPVMELKPALSVTTKGIGSSFVPKKVTTKETTLIPPGTEAAQKDDKKAEESTSVVAKKLETALMSGVLDQVQVGDLLQLLSNSRKSGVLRVTRENESGSLYLQQGTVYYAEIDECANVDPAKAFFWILTWTKGAFELHPPTEKIFSQKIETPLDVLLMEAMRQHDERARVTGETLDPNATLILASPLQKPLSSLSPDQLNIVQLIINYGKVRKVLLHSALLDYQTHPLIMDLIKSGYVKQQ